MTHFTAILALLRWSGTEPTTSPRYACILLYCTTYYYIIQNRFTMRYQYIPTQMAKIKKNTTPCVVEDMEQAELSSLLI